MRSIAILGSTGSIGRQAIEVLSLHRDRYRIFALCANTSKELLFEQARCTGAKVLGLCAGSIQVPEDLKDRTWFFGADAPEKIAALSEVDDVLDAIVGLAGIGSVIQARKHDKRVLLANKETLVAGGEIVMKLCREDDNGPVLLPVDSEHSAIFQCLQGEKMNPVYRIWLTASGGPFRTWEKQAIMHATVEQALGHPTWNMGRKITIDSASMFNKALEIIEAKWLFAVRPQQIQVAVHPQSIVHSMVEFEDGAVKAQLGAPDMRVPILYAATYPERAKTDVKRLDFKALSQLMFFEADTDKFPAIRMAYDALRAGGNACCVMNAANEIAANAFLKEQIAFGDIYAVVEETLNTVEQKELKTLDDIMEADRLARGCAEQYIEKRRRA